MSIFQYKAFNLSGKEVNGHIDAPSLQSAHAQLKKKNLFVKEIKEDIGKRDRQLFPFLSKVLYHVPRKEVSLFARQLGTLLGAGIPLNDALADISEQTRNTHLQKAITEMKSSVTEGKSLSEAMSAHQDFFPAIYENMVRVGEATGSYETTLNQLADVEEKSAELRNKAITAMIYPGIMMLMTVFVVLFLLTSIVPQIESVFASFHAELPFPTRMVLALSKAAQGGWPYLIILTLGAFFGVYRYKKTPKGRLRYDQWLLKLPLFGGLMRKLEVSRFSRNLAALLKANVSLVTGLEIVAATAKNEVFRRELSSAVRAIKEGDSLKNSLQNSVILSHMAKGMIAAGESTDRLTELMGKTADIMENEVDTAVRGLTNSLEPVMILVLGVVVGGIMASIMLPLYKMTTLIK